MAGAAADHPGYATPPLLAPSPALDAVAVLPPRRAGDPCLAVGPGAVWVVGTTWSGPPGPLARRRLRRAVSGVRARLRGTAWATAPVLALATLPDAEVDEHLLRDGTLAAGPAATVACVRRGTALDALDVRGIAALLR